MCRGTVSFENVSARKDGSQLMMNFTTNLSNLRLKSQEMVILTPVLQSVDKSQSYQFNPIVITGRARMKALNRELGFDSYEFSPKTPSLIIRQTKKGAGIDSGGIVRTLCGMDAKRYLDGG